MSGLVVAGVLFTSTSSSTSSRRSRSSSSSSSRRKSRRIGRLDFANFGQSLSKSGLLH